MTPGYFKSTSGPRASAGAALLAFMLVLIVGSSWLLLSDLNEHSGVYGRRVDSGLALNQAKQALLSYAMNYPDLRANPEKGPGFLPCPDRNDDGRPESNCAASTGTTLGRLPFAILGLDDPRDGSGERLWYALSPDFRNTRSNRVIINSETPGQFSVDRVNDVVALVLAPGPPVGNQSRRPSNDAADYLEGDNVHVGDGIFSAQAGNDQVVIISRAELMSVLEQRVINEVRAALAHYRTAHSAYPWLTPFADPHADNRILRGFHTGSNNAATLTDKRKDFIAWGVKPYDIVRNVTDGSIAVVEEVSEKTLGVAGLATGMENDFDKGDVYFIELPGLVHTLTGVAGTGSKGLVLKDPGRDFKELQVVPGDLLENLSDGSSGAIAAVARTGLTAGKLSGGAENDFDALERYRIRSNTGVAAAGSGNLTLVDLHTDFIARGITRGDMLENLGDGSTGRVHDVHGPTRLTVSGLEFGRDNSFSENDVYRLPRYNGRHNTRKGLLSVHEPGKRFSTGFSVEWNAHAADSRMITGMTDDTDPGYAAAVARAIRSSAAAGPVGVNSGNGHCTWLNTRVIDCTGAGPPVPIMEGTATSGSTASVLADRARDFISAGIKPGDLVEAPYAAAVTRVTSSTTLRIRPLTASSPALTEAGRYRIRTATRSLRGIVSAPTAGGFQDPQHDFNATGVQAGDVVENGTDGSFGLITGVNGSNVSAILHGGRGNSFRTGDEYNVYYGYVNRRRYRFNLRYQGNAVTRSAGGARQRIVCLGYGPGCADVPVAVTLPYHDRAVRGTAGPGTTGLTLEDIGADFPRLDVVPGDTLINTTDGSSGMVTAISRHTLTAGMLDGGRKNLFRPGDSYRVSRPVVIIEDLRDARVVARTGLTVSPGGAPGFIRTSGIDHYLSEAPGELPGWFIKNKWHHLIYIAYSPGFVPGGSGRCTAGEDCLTVQGRAGDSEALVVSAGMALAMQDRSTGSIADYYEGENATLYGNDIFAGAGVTGTFNDQVAVAAP